LPACAGGGGIEAPPAHGFKRSLASVNSALARTLCGSPTAGSRGRQRHQFVTTSWINILTTYCGCAIRFAASLIEGVF